MKVTDYIAEFLASKGISHVFGYPGGVICHFIDSVSRCQNIEGHAVYHEQAAAFAACGYAQESGKSGVAYATSGPGAPNLVTGIANAYYDSIPVMFLTGQTDTYSLKGNLMLRQRGFQETDIVSIAGSITKYAARIEKPEDIRYHMEKAYDCAVSGNPGPVLLDLPADVQRAAVEENALRGYVSGGSMSADDIQESAEIIRKNLEKAKRPCILAGNGIKQAGMKEKTRLLMETLDIPAVFSMPAFDVLPYGHKLNYGFIGANGHRYGNFVLGKCDLILSIGSRLDLKQTGMNRGQFAPQAKLVRIDLDEANLAYKVHDDDICIKADIRNLIPEMLLKAGRMRCERNTWNESCQKIREKLNGYDDEKYTVLLEKYTQMLPEGISVTADVGQNGVWIAQKFKVRNGQSVHMSAGHGAMGYSLPAAIGVYYGSRRPAVSFNGDGGMQMNIQELQFLAREKLPVTVVILNNRCLGMIRGFQEANFQGVLCQTVEGRGYSVPDFSKIANAYGLGYTGIRTLEDLAGYRYDGRYPNIVEIFMPENTVLNPNFGKNGEIQNQRPYLDRGLYRELMNL